MTRMKRVWRWFVDLLRTTFSRHRRITIRLNDDVLREIFIICCIESESPKNPSKCFVVGDRKSIRYPPQLSVSRVCSSWRQVALLTPQLWDSIMIRDFTNTNLSIAREYLSRAENLPVSIIFSQRTAIEQGYCPQLTDFLSSFRLRKLTVYPNKAVVGFFDLILPDLPQRSVADLESLLILNHSKGFIDLNDIRYPKLAVVHLRGMYRISGYNNFLRTFDGRRLSMTVSASWDFLSRCPSLEEARLTITRDDWRRRPEPVPLIQLQYLRLLDLYSDSVIVAIPFSTFIEGLALPVIEELRVPKSGIVAWSLTTFQSLAHRSNYFPHLKHFVLRPRASVVDIGALLEIMPSLKSMTVYYLDVAFDHLVLNGLASGSLAPRLQFLIVGYISNEGEFMDMVESRMKNAQMSSDGVPTQFTKVMYHTCHRGPYAARRRLHDMQQRGIPINTKSRR